MIKINIKTIFDTFNTIIKKIEEYNMNCIEKSETNAKKYISMTDFNTTKCMIYNEENGYSVNGFIIQGKNLKFLVYLNEDYSLMECEYIHIIDDNGNAFATINNFDNTLNFY